VTVADSVADMIGNVADAFNPPPKVELSNYPSVVAVIATVSFTAILLIAAKRYDPTGGALTISILITLGMLGAVSYCLIFTIPNDDITPGIVGGLTAGFGAVVAHWLGHREGGVNRAVQPPEPAKRAPDGE
jgi:hypothetical protein